MRTIGNLLWLVLAGFWMAVGYAVAGIVLCVTVVGIPFGIQSFKLAGYALWPFGRVVVNDPDASAALGCSATSCGWSSPAGGWRSATSSPASSCA